MRVIKAQYEILTPIDRVEILKHIELIGRVCYKSEDKITEDSASGFVSKIRGLGHYSVLEHFNLSIRFIASRGFTHELVRHRLASFSQESTRYCNYSLDKFDNEITFIQPYWLPDEGKTSDFDPFVIWCHQMCGAERAYFDLMDKGLSPQAARGVLPLDLKTEIVMTANLREWKHVLNMRCSDKAHPCMRELMKPLQNELAKRLPEIFEVV